MAYKLKLIIKLCKNIFEICSKQLCPRDHSLCQLVNVYLTF